jgi:hypothetical protein
MSEAFVIDMTHEETRARVLLLTHIHALSLEINTNMKLSSRGPSLVSVVKRRWGITGSKVKLLQRLVGFMEEADHTYQMSASVERAMTK